MPAITIRQIRQQWPEIERRLHAEGDLVVTRDAQPVAKLSLLPPLKGPARKRFSAETHARWLKQIWGTRPARVDSGRWLERERREHPAPTP